MTPDGAGCLVFALAVGIPFGLVGAGIGWLLSPLVNIPDFVGTSAIVALVDGFGVATVWYWRSTPRAQEFGPGAIFGLFALIGLRLGRGSGLPGLFLFAVGNGVFGYLVARVLVRRVVR